MGRCGFCPLRRYVLELPLPLLELIYQKEAEERSGSSLISSGNHHPSSLMIRRNWVAIVQMITTPFRQTFFLKNWRKFELRKI